MNLITLNPNFGANKQQNPDQTAQLHSQVIR